MASYDRERLRVLETTSEKITIPSDVVVTLDNYHATHVFIGTEFFNGDTKVTPTGGTVTYTVETAELPEYYQTFPENVVQADTPKSASVAANVKSVKAVFSSITGATHCKVNLGANVS